MTYFADLDVSTIDELPPGRTPVLTKVFADTRRDEVVARIRDEVAQGRQVYWVCPLIEESETLDLRNATQTHAELSAALPGCTVGLLHGRMTPAEKAAVMAQFSAGTLQVLVATTVIEVGVDVPNASLMVIEHAERFGLSQLHQLRGRVGRGAAASVCVLLYTAPLRRHRQGAAEGDGGDARRLRDRAPRPGDPRPRRVHGRAPERRRAAALCRPGRGQRAAAARARASRRCCWSSSRDAARRHVQRWLGRPPNS